MMPLIFQTVKVALWIPILATYFVLLWVGWSVGKAFSRTWLPITCYMGCCAGIMFLPVLWFQFAAGIVTIFSIQWSGLVAPAPFSRAKEPGES